jgi:dTMP kinase
MQGSLLVIEGIDGSGKSLQAKALKEALEMKGKKVLALSYPDKNSDYGKIIYSFLLSNKQMSSEEQFFLYILDMIKDKEKIEKALSSGTFVILDRYFFSTLAYQCSEGFAYARAESLIELSGLRKPDEVFFIDIPIEIAMSRKLKQRGGEGNFDRFENDKEILGKAKKEYDKLLSQKLFCEKWVRIDGLLSSDKISGQILSSLGGLV